MNTMGMKTFFPLARVAWCVLAWAAFLACPAAVPEAAGRWRRQGKGLLSPRGIRYRTAERRNGCATASLASTRTGASIRFRPMVPTAPGTPTTSTCPTHPERMHQEATYGPLEKFGYKDFIPMFTGAKFNADEWADLFQKAGARFAGPVAEHHDGFSMWDTKYSEWNAAKMGPKRDVVGELSKAIKGAQYEIRHRLPSMENWYFFPVWDKRYDCGDPRYSGLYGPIHEKGAQPTKDFLDEWEGKMREVIDKYDPDFIWFDFGLGSSPTATRKICSLTTTTRRQPRTRKWW